MNRIRFYIVLLWLFFGNGLFIYSQVDKRLSYDAKVLYGNMLGIQGRCVLFGHQDDTVYGTYWWGNANESDVKSCTGSYPAVYGWDLGHIETGDSLNIDGVPFKNIREQIIAAYERGGINTLSWHLQNPYTGGSAWDVSSAKAVSSVLPGGNKHDLFISWLDRVADFIFSLKTPEGKLIPILFRPYHEHTGRWFWWGKNNCSKSDYVSLWRFTVKYLRDVRHLHNLLYVYSPDCVSSEADYLDRYPGDDFVDILGQDFYHRGGGDTADKYISKVRGLMKILEAYHEKSGKPYALSETGSNGIPMVNWFTGVLYKALHPLLPVYVLLWRNAYKKPEECYVPYPGHPAKKDFVEFSVLPDIFFENKLYDFYK